MKKALPSSNEVFIYEHQGRIRLWDSYAEDIIQVANTGIPDLSAGEVICQCLRVWFARYLEEGVSDALLDDLNQAIHGIRYAKYILPTDLVASDNGCPQTAYAAQVVSPPDPVAYAADDFSKLLTSGQLNRLKRCQATGCDNFFLGPPQAKWCSKSCGSKQRVREKRRKDRRR